MDDSVADTECFYVQRQNAPDTFQLHATSASVAKSSAMANPRATDAATCRSNAFTRLIAVAPISKIRSMERLLMIEPMLIFAPSEFQAMNAQIQSLQEQVNDLYGQLSAIRGGAPAPYPVQHSIPQESSTSYRTSVPRQARGEHAQYQGHTSNQYNFEVAKSSLQTMGIAEPETGDDGVGGEIDPALGSPIQHQAPMAPMVTQFQKDPLWQLSKGEAVRLCRVYDEELGTMYPLLDMEKTINHASLLFTFTEAAARSGLLRRDKPGLEQMGGQMVNLIKLILANALMIEQSGRSELGSALYESCHEEIESKLSGPVEIKDLVLLVMVVRLRCI